MDGTMKVFEWREMRPLRTVTIEIDGALETVYIGHDLNEWLDAIARAKAAGYEPVLTTERQEQPRG